MTPSITVYTTPSCSQCTMTKNWLDDPKRGNLKGQYEVVSLATDEQAMEAVKALGYGSAPVVIVRPVGAGLKEEMHWYGFRPDMLEQYCKVPAAA